MIKHKETVHPMRYLGRIDKCVVWFNKCVVNRWQLDSFYLNLDKNSSFFRTETSMLIPFVIST